MRALAPEQERGYVAVRGAAAGSTISIDGIPRATAPLEELIEVLPGLHEVAVDHFDHDAVVRSIDVALGESVVIDVVQAASTENREPLVGATAPDQAQRPGGLRVCLLTVRVDDAALGGAAAALAARLFGLLKQVRGVHAMAMPSAPARLAEGVVDTADALAALGCRAEADIVLDVRFLATGTDLVVEAHGQRAGKLGRTTYLKRLRRADMTRALDKIAPHLLNALLVGENVEPLPVGRANSVPRWLFWTTVGAGAGAGLFAVGAGVLYAVAAQGSTDPASLATTPTAQTGAGVALAATLAASAALAVATALEAPRVE